MRWATSCWPTTRRQGSLHPRRAVRLGCGQGYQRKTFDEFKQRYHSLDLLLIDDVQFFANKDRTQESSSTPSRRWLKSHIVMTSDTYPKGWRTSTSAWSRASTPG
jgi:chromosomal replication initiation ATPase DnaA